MPKARDNPRQTEPHGEGPPRGRDARQRLPVMVVMATDDHEQRDGG